LNISGTVALVNTLVVTPNGTNNQTLNITGGETGKNVATVAETSNDANGYAISLSSANGGSFNWPAIPREKLSIVSATTEAASPRPPSQALP